MTVFLTLIYYLFCLAYKSLEDSITSISGAKYADNFSSGWFVLGEVPMRQYNLLLEIILAALCLVMACVAQAQDLDQSVMMDASEVTQTITKV